MNNSYSKLKRKFKITAIQITAMIILPLFVFALTAKVKERNENKIDKVVNTQNALQANYKIQNVSQPITHHSDNLDTSDSAK